MKVVMMVPITKPEGGIVFLHKDFDLPFAPYIGMEIECCIFNAPKKVTHASLIFDSDYENPYVYIPLELLETSNEAEQKRRVEAYKDDGWTTGEKRCRVSQQSKP